jgi:hypothetical protein
MGFFTELLGNLKDGFLKKSIFIVFSLITVLITYFFGYNSGKTGAELQCNITQQRSLEKFNRALYTYNKKIFKSYKDSNEAIQQKIDAYPPYITNNPRNEFKRM